MRKERTWVLLQKLVLERKEQKVLLVVQLRRLLQAEYVTSFFLFHSILLFAQCLPVALRQVTGASGPSGLPSRRHILLTTGIFMQYTASIIILTHCFV
jgi:hypothetical protein